MMINLKKTMLGTIVSLDLIAFSSIQAKADIISIFDLSGSFASFGQPYLKIPLSGSITVDTISGVVQSQALIIDPPYDYRLFSTLSQGYSATANSSFIYVVSPFPGIVQEFIYFNVQSLVNYTGGNLGSTAHPTLGGYVSGFNEQQAPTDIVLTDGIATLEAIPEPSSAGLLAVGIITLAMTALRRKGRRPQQLADARRIAAGARRWA